MRRSALDTATIILVQHQRMDVRSCSCGWDELGKSFAQHVVAKLNEAGVFNDSIVDGDFT